MSSNAKVWNKALLIIRPFVTGNEYGTVFVPSKENTKDTTKTVVEYLDANKPMSRYFSTELQTECIIPFPNEKDYDLTICKSMNFADISSFIHSTVSSSVEIHKLALVDLIFHLDHFTTRLLCLSKAGQDIQNIINDLIMLGVEYSFSVLFVDPDNCSVIKTPYNLSKHDVNNIHYREDYINRKIYYFTVAWLCCVFHGIAKHMTLKQSKFSVYNEMIEEINNEDERKNRERAKFTNCLPSPFSPILQPYKQMVSTNLKNLPELSGPYYWSRH